MSRLVSKLTPEMRTAVVEGLQSIIGNLPDNAQLDVNVSRGYDDVTQPGEDVCQYATNDTWTITMQINGGAQERDRTGEVLMNFVRQIIDDESAPYDYR